MSSFSPCSGHERLQNENQVIELVYGRISQAERPGVGVVQPGEDPGETLQQAFNKPGRKAERFLLGPVAKGRSAIVLS